MKKSIFAIAFAALTLVAFQSCENGGENATDETTEENTRNPLNNQTQGEEGVEEEHSEMENTDLVESGTYTATAEQVDEEEKEIYVRTEDGKLLELYFTENTKLTKKGEKVEFMELEEGQTLEIELQKKGKRLEPLAVTILN